MSDLEKLRSDIVDAAEAWYAVDSVDPSDPDENRTMAALVNAIGAYCAAKKIGDKK